MTDMQTLAREHFAMLVAHDYGSAAVQLATAEARRLILARNQRGRLVSVKWFAALWRIEMDVIVARDLARGHRRERSDHVPPRLYSD